MTPVTPVNSIARGGLFAIVAAVTFGVTTPFVRKLGHGAGPFPTAMLLYVGAALASSRSSKPRGSREAALRREHLPRLMAVALVGAFLAPVCLAWGLQHANGTAASLLLNLEAAFTVLLGWRLYHEPLGRRIILALTLMLAGAASLVVAHPTDAVGLGWGAFAVALAALGWATDNVLTRPLAELDPVQVVRWKSAFGAMLGLALAIASGQTFPSTVHTVGLLACGAFGYGLSLRFYLLAQRRIGAGRTGSIFAVAPFIGAVVAWAMGERGALLATLSAGLLFGIGVYLHLMEKHGHGHQHEPTDHEHAHRHDDGHHDHRDDAVVDGEHVHLHHHDARRHEHSHGSDAHHQHRHS